MSWLGAVTPSEARDDVRGRFAQVVIGQEQVVATASARPPSHVVVFDPTPVLTIVVESLDGRPDVHLHAGGQGVWVARMLVELGVPAHLCSPIGGETGVVLAGLARDEGIELRAVDSPGACGSYINDRRSGKREEWVAMPPTPLGRHVLDELYGLLLAEATGASAAVLTGPREAGALPADTYRRLAGDCRGLGTPVVGDLTGEALAAALTGGLTVLKISEDDLRTQGRLGDDSGPDDCVAAALRLHEDGAEQVVVSRGPQPTLALIDGRVHWIRGPELSPADHRGAGDSMTAGITSGLARGLPLEEAVRIGVAAGAVTVSRHGLATADRRSIDSLLTAVSVDPDPAAPGRRPGLDDHTEGQNDARTRDQR